MMSSPSLLNNLQMASHLIEATILIQRVLDCWTPWSGLIPLIDPH